MRIQNLTGLMMAIAIMALLPIQVCAEDTMEQPKILEGESMEYYQELTEEYPVNLLMDEGPVLADGNHEKWIDRIGNLPDYASRFYSWLENNANAEGALTDVTKGENVSSSYVHTVDTISGTIDVTVMEGATNEEVSQAALEAVRGALNANMQELFPYITAVYNAFDRDHPEVFWLSGECMVNTRISYSYRVSGTKCTVSYSQPINFCLKTDTFDVRSTKYRNVSDITAAIAECDSSINSILTTCNGTTRYEKVKYFNEWLTKHNSYNSSSNLNNISNDCRECISALKGSVGEQGPVCEAYAKALKVLCDNAQIPCVLVNGVAYNGFGTEAHMWNYVQMDDGKWYAIDITWNDPVVSGTNSAVSGYENENYFLAGSKTVIHGYSFEDSHVVYNTVSNDGIAFINGPVLEEQAYDPTFTPKNGILQAEDGKYYYYVNGNVDTTKNGLVFYEESGQWMYMENGCWITSKVGLVEYDGSKFLVVNGCFDNSVTQLYLNTEDSTWYYLSNGQVQTHHSGLTQYDGAWFYVENGKLATDYRGLTDYAGGKFYVSGGQVQSQYNGLVQTPDGAWYYVGGGQVQSWYTGLVMYDGAWFYVENGILASSFNGIQDYDGSKFLVIGGQLKNEYTGLYLNEADATWYYIGGGQVQAQYTGLVEYSGALFYVKNGVLDTSFNGTVIYNGTEYKVVNGSVILE